MDKKQIWRFLYLNKDTPQLLDYYNKTYEKLKELNKYINKLVAYLFITVFIFLITSNSGIQSFQVGPVTINDVSIVVKVLPVLFSYLLVEYAIYIRHQQELSSIVKHIAASIYKQKVDIRTIDKKHNFVIWAVMPFSYYSELQKMHDKKLSKLQKVIALFLLIPVIIMAYLPFLFEGYMLHNIWQYYMTDTLGRISFFLSLWIMLFTIYFKTNIAAKKLA